MVDLKPRRNFVAKALGKAEHFIHLALGDRAGPVIDAGVSLLAKIVQHVDGGQIEAERVLQRFPRPAGGAIVRGRA
jgi:hypothetical protein